MPTSKTLITFGSWEDRFLQGFERDVETWRPQSVVMYYYESYSTWTFKDRKAVEGICQEAGVSLHEHALGVDTPAQNWRMIRDTILEEIPRGSLSLVELTTMPREVIWLVFWFLDFIKNTVRYVYYRPESYSEDWLSRDPEKPRLVYRMSGISRLDRRTCLLVIPGYDFERMQQLRAFYEPAVTLIGLQSGAGDSRNEERMKKLRARYENEHGVRLFTLNAYGSDHGQATIESEIAGVSDTHNIIVSSLGPKLSAVSLYRIHRNNPDVGLTYAPSKEFNQEYSRGIADRYEGEL